MNRVRQALVDKFCTTSSTLQPNPGTEASRELLFLFFLFLCSFYFIVSLYLCKREEVNEDKETALNHCCEISKKIVLNLLTCIPIYSGDVVRRLVAVIFVEALSLNSSACSAICNGHSWMRIMWVGAHAVLFQLCFLNTVHDRLWPSSLRRLVQE